MIRHFRGGENRPQKRMDPALSFPIQRLNLRCLSKKYEELHQQHGENSTDKLALLQGQIDRINDSIALLEFHELVSYRANPPVTSSDQSADGSDREELDSKEVEIVATGVVAAAAVPLTTSSTMFTPFLGFGCPKRQRIQRRRLPVLREVARSWLESCLERGFTIPATLCSQHNEQWLPQIGRPDKNVWIDEVPVYLLHQQFELETDCHTGINVFSRILVDQPLVAENSIRDKGIRLKSDRRIRYRKYVTLRRKPGRQRH